MGGILMDIDLRKLRLELVWITKNLLGDKALEEGEVYEHHMPIENMKPMPNSTPKKKDAPSAVATLVRNIKRFPLENLKHVLSLLPMRSKKEVYLWKAHPNRLNQINNPL